MSLMLTANTQQHDGHMQEAEACSLLLYSGMQVCNCNELMWSMVPDNSKAR